MSNRNALLAIIGVLAFAIVLNGILIAAFWPRAPAAPELPPGPEQVELMVIVPDCEECFDATQYQPELAAIGVSFGETQTLDAALPEAKRLIKKYNVTKLPALLFSEELGTYPEIAQAWPRVGSVAKDGTYVLQAPNPPYYDLAEQRVRGLVTVTFVNDSSCDGCYDVLLHRQILDRMGIVVQEERFVDLASLEGAALAQRYGIVAAPTILLDEEANTYLGFEQLWNSIGQKVEDRYVFTQLSSLGMPYKDLSTGELVVPEQPALE